MLSPPPGHVLWSLGTVQCTAKQYKNVHACYSRNKPAASSTVNDPVWTTLRDGIVTMSLLTASPLPCRAAVWTCWATGSSVPDTTLCPCTTSALHTVARTETKRQTRVHRRSCHGGFDDKQVAEEQLTVENRRPRNLNSGIRKNLFHGGLVPRVGTPRHGVGELFERDAVHVAPGEARVVIQALIPRLERVLSAGCHLNIQR